MAFGSGLGTRGSRPGSACASGLGPRGLVAPPRCTGTLADWFVATDFAQRYPVILAGGLTPENAADAIRRVKPFGIDVSSGVETDRVKDPSRIRAFIAAAKAAGHVAQPAR